MSTWMIDVLALLGMVWNFNFARAIDGTLFIIRDTSRRSISAIASSLCEACSPSNIAYESLRGWFGISNPMPGAEPPRINPSATFVSDARRG